MRPTTESARRALVVLVGLVALGGADLLAQPRSNRADVRTAHFVRTIPTG